MALAIASSWSILDYRRLVVQATAASGIADARLPQVPQDELWLLERAVVLSTSSATTRALLYLDTPEDRNIVEGTTAGNFDIADESSPVQIPGGSVLLCRWVGPTDGAVCTLTAQLTILRNQGRR